MDALNDDVDVELIADGSSFGTLASLRMTPSPRESEDLTEHSELPELHALFCFYDDAFFYSALQSVEVRWSTKMTLCAGLCVYNRGGYCSIRLSEPLLKYRTVQNYKETLLHEMIHAYLFVVKNQKDRESHGAEFQYHMHRINQLTGLNITIYHNFNEEVDYYRRHIWRCNGPCRFRPPRYGFLKRAMNRAPGPTDFWWNDHVLSCGGVYEKVAEPPKKSKPGRKRSKERLASSSLSFETPKEACMQSVSSTAIESLVKAHATPSKPPELAAVPQPAKRESQKTLDSFVQRVNKRQSLLKEVG